MTKHYFGRSREQRIAELKMASTRTQDQDRAEAQAATRAEATTELLGIVALPRTGCPLKSIERLAVVAALEYTAWNQIQAAKLLSITPRVMNYKMATHGIRRPVDSKYSGGELLDVSRGDAQRIDTACCTGINGSHTHACPTNTGDTIVCWRCGRTLPCHFNMAWGKHGSRCLYDCLSEKAREIHGEPPRPATHVPVERRPKYLYHHEVIPVRR